MLWCRKEIGKKKKINKMEAKEKGKSMRCKRTLSLHQGFIAESA